MARIEIEAEGVKARLELLYGMISELVVERDGRKVSMLHKAPWLGEKMPGDAAPHLGGLAGDFFCIRSSISAISSPAATRRACRSPTTRWFRCPMAGS